MKHSPAILLWLIAIVSGCGPGYQESALPPETESLTLEIWETLPNSEKYDGATLERLRESDPALESESAWNRFMRETVVPQMREDIPTVDE